MGYHIFQEKSKFRIDKKDQQNALRAIQALQSKETIRDSSGSHFMWVRDDFSLINDLAKMLKAWRWHPKFDDADNIIGLAFTGEKAGDDLVLFNAIAPYVEKGSFIGMRGEDGDHWHYLFTGTTCEEKQGKITYFG